MTASLDPLKESAMPRKAHAKELHDGAYHACTLHGDLIVSSKHGQRGRRLLAPAADEWIKAIRAAVDQHEADALCRAILHA